MTTSNPTGDQTVRVDVTMTFGWKGGHHRLVLQVDADRVDTAGVIARVSEALSEFEIVDMYMEYGPAAGAS